MRAYVEKLADAVHRETIRRATHVPRRERPRRARATFVPVAHSPAFSH